MSVPSEMRLMASAKDRYQICFAGSGGMRRNECVDVDVKPVSMLGESETTVGGRRIP